MWMTWNSSNCRNVYVKLTEKHVQKEMATHSSVLAWRIPGTGDPGGLPSMASHRVGHDWSDFAAAAGFNSTWTENFYIFTLDHRKNNRIPEKHLLLLYWLYQSLWLCGSQQTAWSGIPKKKWEYQSTWPASWEICRQVKKQQLELDIEQGLVTNLERSMSRLYIITLLI